MPTIAHLQGEQRHASDARQRGDGAHPVPGSEDVMGEIGSSSVERLEVTGPR
jgi:hypothetical protein